MCETGKAVRLAGTATAASKRRFRWNLSCSKKAGQDISNVWVIADGHVSRSAAVRSDAKSTIPLAQRGVAQLLRQLLYISVRDAEARTLQAGAHFHLIPLPETIPEAASPFEFKPEEMRGLFEAGREIGLQRFGTTVMPTR